MSFSKNQQSHETRVEQMMETRNKLEDSIRIHQATKERLDSEINALKQKLSVSETKLADVCTYVHTWIYSVYHKVHLLPRVYAFIFILRADTISIERE